MQAEVPFWGVLTLYLYFKQVKDCVWVCMGVHFPSFLPHYQTPELHPDFDSKVKLSKVKVIPALPTVDILCLGFARKMSHIKCGIGFQFQHTSYQTPSCVFLLFSSHLINLACFPVFLCRHLYLLRLKSTPLQSI